MGSAVTSKRGAIQAIPYVEIENLEQEGILYQFKESDFLV